MSETQEYNNPQLAYLPWFQKAEYTWWWWETPEVNIVMLEIASPVVYILLTTLVFTHLPGHSCTAALKQYPGFSLSLWTFRAKELLSSWTAQGLPGKHLSDVFADVLGLRSHEVPSEDGIGSPTWFLSSRKHNLYLTAVTYGCKCLYTHKVCFNYPCSILHAYINDAFTSVMQK